MSFPLTVLAPDYKNEFPQVTDSILRECVEDTFKYFVTDIIVISLPCNDELRC